MKHLLLGLALLALPAAPVYSQIPVQAETLAAQRGKIELILRVQDTRTVYNGKLVSLLTDDDPRVRERAVLAFGSIQDTSAMNLLMDRLTSDRDGDVQYAAAFAIGQTAGSMSRKTRRALEHDLIWSRLDLLPSGADPGRNPADRLIEELGRFGTEQALDDLMLRFGTTEPPPHLHAMIMSIARFAMRGIVSTDAVRYLEKRIKPTDSAPWEAVYALQRIGRNDEIKANLEQIVPLYTNADPLVRMYLASLLGKVRNDNICLEPLQKLAEFDPDWRVRVNAFKALGNFDLRGREGLIQSFRRGMLNDNMYVALAAIEGFATAHVTPGDSTPAARETLAQLERFARNEGDGYLWQLQAAAAMTAARLEKRAAARLIKPTAGPQPLLQAQLLIALGTTGSPDAAPTIIRFASGDDGVLRRAALEALSELGKRNPRDTAIVNAAYEASRSALASRDVALVTTAAGILADSLFLRPSSVQPLLDALDEAHVPDDIEAIQQIASTLGVLKDRRAVEPLRAQFGKRDRSVNEACASALTSITGQDYAKEASEYFEPIFTDFDFQFLEALPETVRVKMETIRGDVVMEWYRDVAPFTVMSMVKLTTQRGFFRGRTFHRVVPTFVIQGGDPRGDGWGGPGYSIRSEFSPLTYETGTVGMASAGKDTEGSQFFITQSPQPHLDGRYTIFGKVVSGMDVVDRIQVDDHIYDIKIIR